MEELSERLVRLPQYEIPESPWTVDSDISTVDDDEAIISISQDDRAARYQRIILELNEDLLQMSREFTAFCLFPRPETPKIFLDDFRRLRNLCSVDLLVEERQEAELLLGGVSQWPQPTLRKARRKRDPPPRVSRRSSQVSPPIYLRHRFLPQSRKQSSFLRQR